MTTPLRVLFVEDGDADVHLLTGLLRAGGYDPAWERVDTPDALRAALHRGAWDIIISDFHVPRFGGLEALAIHQEVRTDVPFLLVSGSVGEDVAVESIKAGASDYLMKDNLIRFVPAVARALRDATARRSTARTELALRESRDRLSLIYNNAGDALALYTWVPDFGWRLDSVNAAWLGDARRLGVAAGERDVLGGTLDDIYRAYRPYPPETVEALFEEFRKASETGRTRSAEFQYSSPAGTVSTEKMFVPFHGSDGLGRHVLVAGRDVTARKRAEEEQRKLEGRLAQARKLEALGQLAGGIAHDFNNNIQAMLGYAEVLLASPRLDAPAERECAERILRGAERARDLVQQILAFSRKTTLDRRAVPLGPVVEETAALVRGTAPSGVLIETRTTAGLPCAFGDATQLHRVLLNLLTNAVQALPTGGRVVVALEAVRPADDFVKANAPMRPGECLRLTVSDDGSGIAPEALDHLFEPFFTTKPVGVGTGLGLAVVHGIVQNHDGAIAVRSAPAGVRRSRCSCRSPRPGPSRRRRPRRPRRPTAGGGASCSWTTSRGSCGSATCCSAGSATGSRRSPTRSWPWRRSRPTRAGSTPRSPT